MNQFVCNQCGESFEQKSPYDRHMAGTHAPRTLSAAALQEALTPVEFPKSKADLLEFASRQLPMDATIVEALEALPDRVYRSAAEVARTFGAATSKQPEQRREATPRAP